MSDYSAATQRVMFATLSWCYALVASCGTLTLGFGATGWIVSPIDSTSTELLAAVLLAWAAFTLIAACGVAKNVFRAGIWLSEAASARAFPNDGPPGPSSDPID